MDVYVVIIIVLLVVIAAGALYCYYGRKENYPYPADYATLGTMYAQRLFEPDIVKRCAEGSYMYSDNPQLGAFCSTVPPEVMSKVACSRAFVGRPYHMSYTVPSNVCGCSVQGPSCCSQPKLTCGYKEPVMRLD